MISHSYVMIIIICLHSAGVRMQEKGAGPCAQRGQCGSAASSARKETTLGAGRTCSSDSTEFTQNAAPTSRNRPPHVKKNHRDGTTSHLVRIEAPTPVQPRRHRICHRNPSCNQSYGRCASAVHESLRLA